MTATTENDDQQQQQRDGDEDGNCSFKRRTSQNHSGDVTDKILPIYNNITDNNSNHNSINTNEWNRRVQECSRLATAVTFDSNCVNIVRKTADSSVANELVCNNNNLLGDKFAAIEEDHVHVVDADVHESDNGDDCREMEPTAVDVSRHSIIANGNGNNCDLHVSAFKKKSSVNKAKNSGSKFSFKKPSNKVSVLIHRHTL